MPSTACLKLVPSCHLVPLPLHPHCLTTLTMLPPCAGAGYMGQVLKDAQDRNLPLQDLYLNQYIKVHAIRMLVDVDTSCQVSALHW